MSDAERITGLISDIYDAALDAGLWPHVLRRTMALLDGVSAAIFSDAGLPTEHFCCAIDVDPAFAESYVSHYMRLNPLIPFETGLPAGTVFSASDAMPYETLRASIFFNEWARPQGLADFTAAVIENSPQRMVKLMVNRPESRGPTDERARAAMTLLAPHFRRAVAIGRTLERSESKAGALGAVLERLSAAVVFVDRAGRLVHANEPATRMLAANEVLSWTDGRPRPRDERAAAHLQAILASARRGGPAADSSALSVAHATQSGEALTVHILPLSAGAHRQALTPGAAAAAVIVSQQKWDLPQRLQSAARLYSLTPAESRVVNVLLTGCTIGSAAKALGIKEATVKTHLQHVFDKTGTRRQVDLARRITDCARLSLSGAAPQAGPAFANEQMGDV
ncbi:MAG TPA: helix-turn-helix transcriptional regulator [Steroidobacteraceae bacterium]|nr:helix-turn-helix transcriptional regulator [Steroidobacteraceae bacterium]